VIACVFDSASDFIAHFSAPFSFSPSANPSPGNSADRVIALEATVPSRTFGFSCFI
jgi:hypothetical protein